MGKLLIRYGIYVGYEALAPSAGVSSVGCTSMAHGIRETKMIAAHKPGMRTIFDGSDKMECIRGVHSCTNTHDLLLT